MGRWTRKDSLGFAGLDTNLYAYASGDPINRIDVDGLQSKSKQCADLLKKIENVQSEIDKRIGELKEDKLKLPEACPGDDEKPRLSKRGHRRLIEMHKANLAALKALYLARCGPPPGGMPSTSQEKDVRKETPNVFDRKYWEMVTGLTGGALTIYLIISEGSRIIPARNLVPIP